MNDNIEFWFDPACPWAWNTSRWVLEAAKARTLSVTWNVMSLYLLNEDRLEELPEQYRELMPKTRPAVRLAAAVAKEYDNATLLRLYTALGEQTHRKDVKDPKLVIPAALAEARLPSDLEDAAYSTEYDEFLQQSHNRAMSLVGTDVGTPVIAVNNRDGEQVGFFGPVLTSVPKGEAAGILWDGVYNVGITPEFYELKRTRTSDPIID